jgi:putative addiction module killer protein
LQGPFDAIFGLAYVIEGCPGGWYVRARLNRIRLGNFGDCKSVGSGVEELRIDFGPGYRIYYGREGSLVVILLCGGSKASQARDILRAQRYWKEYLDAKTNG